MWRRIFRSPEKERPGSVYEYGLSETELAEMVARSRRALAKTPEARTAAKAVTDEKYLRAILGEFELQLAHEVRAGVARFN